MERMFPGGYWTEFKSTMRIAWALALTQTFELYFQPIATMFGGQLGTEELDAITLSNTIINVMGTSVIIGFSTAFETVLSQSFGRGNYEMVGIYFQRGLILTILVLIPCYVMQLNIVPILIACGQDETVSILVGQYLTIFTPGMFSMFLGTIIRKFTQCQNDVNPHVIIILIGHVVHALLQYLFIYQLKIGLAGSAIAQDLTYVVILVMTIIYTVKSEAFKQSWGGFSIQALEGLGELGLLGIYGVVMLCLEWWAFELSIIVAGILGTTQLAAHSVVVNLDAICFAVPAGISVSTSLRVGQLLGAEEPEKSKTAAKVGATITVANALIWLIIYCTARHQLPKLFTKDPQVIRMASNLIPILAGFTLADAITTIGRGIFRGAGKQLLGTITVLMAFYFIAIPVALSLTFLTPLGLTGIWIGFIIATYTNAVGNIGIFYWFLDWEKLAKEAVQRAQGSASGQEKDSSSQIMQIEEKRSLISSDGTKVNMKKIILVFIFFALVLLAGIVTRCLTQGAYYNIDCNHGNVTKCLYPGIPNGTHISNTTGVL